MKKFFMVACLILAGAFVSVCAGYGFKTALAAGYSDDQAMNTMRSKIKNVLNQNLKWWSHRESDWTLCAASECYLTTSGIVYTIMRKPGKVFSTWIITQVDLNSKSFRMVEGYVWSVVDYSVAKMEDSKISKNWRTESIFKDYCDYLQSNYQQINGVAK